jgi:hypothetical protein
MGLSAKASLTNEMAAIIARPYPPCAKVLTMTIGRGSLPLICRINIWQILAEGDEAWPEHGHLDHAEPLVNPIRAGSGFALGRRRNMRLTHRLSLILGTVVSLASLLAGLIVLPATAHAAPTVQHVNFSGTATGVDLCGINTTLAFEGVDNFFPVFDSSGNLIAFKDMHQEQDTFTAANGKAVTIHTADQVTATLTLNPDGTFTQVITFKGMPEQIKTPNGPVLTQDVGIATFVRLFDSSGNFISQTVIVEKGPHPDLDSGFTVFCQVITAALS